MNLKLKSLYILGLLLCLQSCVSTNGATDAALQLAVLPIKIVGVAIAALIGAAAGMGMFPG